MSEFGLTAEFKNSAKEGGITPSSRQPVHMPEFIDFVDAATMPADAMPSPVPGMDMREYKMNIAMALSVLERWGIIERLTLLQEAADPEALPWEYRWIIRLRKWW